MEIKRTGTIESKDATLSHHRAMLVRELADGSVEYLVGDSAHNRSGWASLPDDMLRRVEWGAAAAATRRVMSYGTGERLAGAPSEALAEASDAETGGTGAVLAYRDGDGVWQHVPDHQESFFRDVRGEDVVTVYVEA